MIRQFLLLTFPFILLQAKATVVLESSSNQTCPGDTVVFTCTTDTGELVWYENNKDPAFLNMDHHPASQQLDIFTVNLINISGMVIVSTATISNVLVEHNGIVLACSDNSIPHVADTINKTFTISDLLSPPLNLTFSFTCSNFSVTISWVAPLDTPLCVHSYTITVMNSSISPQVMVYNTTDNRSSLSITNLTSDGEYSVTVAGRDGAGRLGQESKELIFNLQISNITNITHSIVSTENGIYGLLVEWKVTNKFNSCNNNQMCKHFLIRHNVSEECPIKIDRTSVTLYGVTPGNTYNVDILSCNNGSSVKTVFSIPEGIVSTKNESEACFPIPIDNSERFTMGHIVSISALVFLVFVIVGYIILFIFFIKSDFTVTRHEDIGTFAVTNTGNIHSLTQSSKEIHDKDTCFECVKENATKQDIHSSLPTYDSLHHQ